MPGINHQALFSAKSVKTVPVKPKNSDRRTREFLSEHEIKQMRTATRRRGRNGLRDDTLILMMFRHGLRVSEAATLRWEPLDLKQGLLHVRRRKGGVSATHPLTGIQLRALKRLQRQYSDNPYVFISERQTPLTARAIHHIISRAGKLAGIPFSIHPHMLRHSTGFYLANKGYDTRAIQAYLGHANIQNTVGYTQLSAQRFKGFWVE